jgi:hypothetical protein
VKIWLLANTKTEEIIMAIVEHRTRALTTTDEQIGSFLQNQDLGFTGLLPIDAQATPFLRWR